MGIVYKAHDPQLSRDVALKIMIEIEPKKIERFTIESTAMAQLNHPHLIRIYDLGRKPQPYFVMEYIEGDTLEDLIKAKKTKPRAVVTTMIKICNCLQEMHKQNIIHRDIKPANIMISNKGEPKLMDLGLAKFTNFDSNLSIQGEIIGTPRYMAPEQISGNTNSVTDIYAIGATMYEALTHTRLFESDSPTSLLYQVVSEKPTPLREINPKLTPELEKICLKCLEKDPKERFQSCEELAKALQRFQNRRKASRIEKKQEAQRSTHNMVTGSLILLVVLMGAVSFYLYTAYENLKNDSEVTQNPTSNQTENVKNFAKVKNHAKNTVPKPTANKTTSADAHFINAKKYKRLKQYSAAHTSLNSAIELEDKDIYHCHKANIYALEKKYNKAILHLQMALKHHPKSPNIYYAMANIHLHQKKYDFALEFLLNLSNENDNHAANKNNSYIQKLFIMGNCYHGLLNYKKAIYFWHKALEHGYPSNKKLLQKIDLAKQKLSTAKNLPNAKIYYAQAKKLQESRATGENKQQILQYLHKAILADPSFAAAYNFRGNTYKSMSLNLLAITDYSSAIKYQHKSIYYRNRFAIYLNTKNYKKALNDIEILTSLQPQIHHFWALKSEVLFHLKKPYEAIKAIDHAITLDKKNAQYYFLKGKIFFGNRNYTQAIKWLHIAQKYNPKLPYIYRKLGDTYFSQQQYKKAIDFWQKAHQYGYRPQKELTTKITKARERLK
ncbi:serine/threonine protein kinase [Candidatus Uabimicrobium amorphum]|uniref:non-specific serine/threonine protein kinase n=2 Tax=Uabimicrobium amorphum TaxID=2596890 RepID=A0A5S9F488_UABAM|nr:serine/threonine protein kinase [Candidatus Uabimicrobium amorphum]